MSRSITVAAATGSGSLFENETGSIAVDDLTRVQKIVSFHNELEINKEGIEVILRLLEQIDANQAVIDALKNRFRVYEDKVKLGDNCAKEISF